MIQYSSHLKWSYLKQNLNAFLIVNLVSAKKRKNFFSVKVDSHNKIKIIFKKNGVSIKLTLF